MSASTQYHIKKPFSATFEYVIESASDAELQTWANDPSCIEAELCAREIAHRSRKKEQTARIDMETQQWENRRRELLERHPFDPRTELSADAVHIGKRVDRLVTHLWIIVVLLPFVLGVLYYLMTH